MKRSEMVKYMVDKINQIYTVQNIESLEESELAEWLLESIEEKGMLPPRTYLKSLDTYDNGWDDEWTEKTR